MDSKMKLKTASDFRVVIALTELGKTHSPLIRTGCHGVRSNPDGSSHNSVSGETIVFTTHRIFDSPFHVRTLSPFLQFRTNLKDPSAISTRFPPSKQGLLRL